MFKPILEKDEEYLSNKIFVGIVEENKDPKRKGRVKVRVQSIFKDIKLEHIPWASPFKNLDGKSFCVPAIGKVVNVIFPQGNLYEPHYIYSENYNVNLQDKLESMSDDEYANFVAILFDHRTQVYSDDMALTLDYFSNAIRIKKESIDVKLKNNEQILNLGHSTCDQNAVLGTNFFRWFDSFMEVLSIPNTLTGNLGAPILRPALDQKILEYKQLRNTFLSKHVRIVDNDKIIQDSYNEKRLNTPIKDDATKINDIKILETAKQETKPTPETEKGDVIEEKKDSLPEKILEERKKDLIELKENEPSGNTIRPLYEINYEDDIDPDVAIERENKFNQEIEETMNDDPYAGFWAGMKGRKSQDIGKPTSSTPGYGSFYYEDSNTATTSRLELGSSNSITVSGAVATDKVILPPDLKAVGNSIILTKQSINGKFQDIRDMTYTYGKNTVTIKGNDIVKCMNEFIQDVLGPLATFLKEKYPDLYKKWYFTSASRAYMPDGGSPVSQHFLGQAVDFQCLGFSDFNSSNDLQLRLMNAILDFYSKKPVGYDQFLFETRGKKSCWLHLSYKRNNNRLQTMRLVNDVTYNSPMNKIKVYLKSIDKVSANLYL